MWHRVALGVTKLAHWPHNSCPTIIWVEISSATEILLSQIFQNQSLDTTRQGFLRQEFPIPSNCTSYDIWNKQGLSESQWDHMTCTSSQSPDEVSLSTNFIVLFLSSKSYKGFPPKSKISLLPLKNLSTLLFTQNFSYLPRGPHETWLFLVKKYWWRSKNQKFVPCSVLKIFLQHLF